MIGMTLCSGIGAPEMAAPWVDWRLSSEIEPFPRAVLQERFGYRLPENHNQGDPLLWGDMTEVTPDLLHQRGIPLPDLIVAGTPCQAFSIAGLRGGTEDARGNLTLKFVETCHAIVDARPDGQLAVLWENVPGVLSDKSNAFGCFLGGLVGADNELLPAEREWGFKHKSEFVTIEGEGDEQQFIEKATVGGAWGWQRISWPSTGMVAGSRARAAWRVLDAQYFGVAQRRRRVFVVIDFGNCVDPAAVLFERQGLRGHTPPRRKAGKDVASTISAHPTGGGGHGTDFDCDGGLIASEHPYSGTVSAKWAKGSGGPAGDECQNLVAHSISPPVTSNPYGDHEAREGLLVAHTLRGAGFDASEDGSGRATPLIPISAPLTARMGDGASRAPQEQGALIPVAFDCKGTEVQTDSSGGETPLRSMGHHKSHQNAGGHAAIAIQERAVSDNPDAGPDGAGFRTDDAAYTLEARTVPQAVAFAENQHGADRTSDVSPALSIGGGKPGQGYPAVMEPFTLAERGRDGGQNLEYRQDGTSNAILTPNGGRGGMGVGAIAHPWAVRRLTPTECHRLQGFPDDHCAITYRNKPAADGNQYKALGNSMAVPCIKWIMDLIKISWDQK
jgi:DNA (cytosine-5)-methyltransferase 1